MRELAARPDLWDSTWRSTTPMVADYVSLHRDADVDIWLLCWNLEDDTGWHDHDLSSGAVAVTRGAVRRAGPGSAGSPPSGSSPRAGRSASAPTTSTGWAVVSTARCRSTPTPRRCGGWAVHDRAGGEMRRVSVSYAEELRPLDD